MGLTLREELESKTGSMDDRAYGRLLSLALDDLRQYNSLTSDQLLCLTHDIRFPPNDSAHERIALARDRLLDTMVMLWDILRRRGIPS